MIGDKTRKGLFLLLSGEALPVGNVGEGAVFPGAVEPLSEEGHAEALLAIGGLRGALSHWALGKRPEIPTGHEHAGGLGLVNIHRAASARLLGLGGTLRSWVATPGARWRGLPAGVLLGIALLQVGPDPQPKGKGLDAEPICEPVVEDSQAEGLEVALGTLNGDGEVAESNRGASLCRSFQKRALSNHDKAAEDVLGILEQVGNQAGVGLEVAEEQAALWSEEHITELLQGLPQIGVRGLVTDHCQEEAQVAHRTENIHAFPQEAT